MGSFEWEGQWCARQTVRGLRALSRGRLAAVSGKVSGVPADTETDGERAHGGFWEQGVSVMCWAS